MPALTERLLLWASIALWLSASARYCSPVAHADTMILPIGTTIQRPGESPVTLDRTRFAIEREDADQIRTSLRREPELEAALAGCAAELREERSKPEPPSRTRWMGAGIAVGLAMAGSIWLGALL